MHLKEEIVNTLTIEKSKFICYLKTVKSEDEFKDFLSQIKKKHYDASHICSGFICGNLKRSNDDGEPSGTAGMPILNVLEKNHLNQMAALVVRYFGGIKLGIGGLIRAYGNAVNEALLKGTLVEDIIYPKYSLTLSYELANKIEHYLKNNTLLLDINYDVNITYTFALDDKNKIKKIIEYTKGQEPTYLEDILIETVVK